MLATFAALHFLLAFTLVACLAAELALLRGPSAQLPFSSLAKIDAVYGLSAVLLVAVGVYRALFLDKGWDYYSQSIPFILKLSLFGLVALLSIHPTVQFIRARRGGREMTPQAVRRIRMIVALELVLIAALIVCASMAARGIGFAG